MKNPDFLTLADVLDIHEDQIKKYGGDPGLRDMGLLESGIAVPKATFRGQYLHGSLFDMAAAYAYHIAENRPFIDGNKRAALASALVFLKLNGIALEDPSRRLFGAMIQVGTRRLSKEKLGRLLQELYDRAA